MKATIYLSIAISVSALAQTSPKDTIRYTGKISCKSPCNPKNTIISSYWTMEGDLLVAKDPDAETEEDSVATVSQANERGEFVFDLPLKHQHLPFLIYAVDATQKFGGFGWLPEQSTTPIKIRLSPLIDVHGKVRVLDEFNVIDWHYAISWLSKDGKQFSTIGVLAPKSDQENSNEYRFRLPAGTYRFWVDAGDSTYNYRRILIDFDLSSKDQSVKTLADRILQAKLTTFVGKKIGDWNMSSKLYKTLSSITSGKVMAYLFADYCSPCLSENGLAWFYNEALSTSNDSFSVLGIHTDFYERSSKNKEEFLDKIRWEKDQNKNVTNKERLLYSQLQRMDPSANQHAQFFLDHGELAKELEILGYPTLLFFDNGVLTHWIQGSDEKGHQYFQNWIKN